MSRLKIWYACQRYMSHSRVALDYRSMLQPTCELVDNPGDADLVILHREPHVYRRLFEQLPILHTKYVIGYCVWEASRLPPCYIDSLSFVKEVWTCSDYCHNIFGSYHPSVTTIPHAIYRDTSVERSDVIRFTRMLGIDSSNIVFLTVGRLWDKRKNILTLCREFSSLREHMPRARLIVKCSPKNLLKK